MSLKHTSIFVTSMLYNFCWEKSENPKLAQLINQSLLLLLLNFVKLPIANDCKIGSFVTFG